MATANFTLNTRDVFPNTTVVKAYPSTNWPTPNTPSGAPIGSATQEKTVSEGKAAFTGLTVGVKYYAVAEVGGVYRYMTMVISQGTEITGVATGALKQVITVLAAKGIVTDGTTES